MTVRTSTTELIKTLGQSLLSLSSNLGALLAGTFIALNLNVLTRTPWILALFPGILSIRGAIGGLFSGRLSTGLHLGTVKPRYTQNTADFYLLFYVVVTLTLESSIVVGLVASLFNVAVWGASIVDCVSIIAVVVSTMGLSIVLISPITVAVSILSFRRGLDPDVTVYPVMATVADILVTLCYILELNVFFSGTLGVYFIGLTSLIFLLIGLSIVFRNVREDMFVKTIKEFFVVLVLVAFIVNVTGSLLYEIREVVGNRPEIFVVYPALIDTVGSVGSIVGSTATTKLFLGVLKSSFSSIKQHLAEIGGTWIASVIMFAIYSVIPFFTSEVALFNPLMFTAQLVTTNILAVSIMIVIAFAVAIFTYRRGLDPDNFVIPIESSLADSITTVSFLVTLSVIV